jgi:hypothetical protein
MQEPDWDSFLLMSRVLAIQPASRFGWTEATSTNAV